MKFINDEILFRGHDEAEEHAEYVRNHLMVLYTCNKCGINFASYDPYTSDGGIICRVCMKALNLREEDNYRPDYFEPDDMDDLFDTYNDNKLYDTRGDDEWL